jgi:hypothetical protein
LVITAEPGKAIATCRVEVPARFQARLTASTTPSILAILPSDTASLGNTSMV